MSLPAQLCPKCGVYSEFYYRYLTTVGQTIETMVRTCSNCGYQYTEPCADQEKS